jgi:hypothetical protein
VRQGYQERGISGEKAICLPFPDDEYDALIEGAAAYRAYLNEQIFHSIQVYFRQKSLRDIGCMEQSLPKNKD